MGGAGGSPQAPESQEEVFSLAAGHGGIVPLSDLSKGPRAFPGLWVAALCCSWATWAQLHLRFQRETAVQNRSPKWDTGLHLDKTPAPCPSTSLSGACVDGDQLIRGLWERRGKIQEMVRMH